MQFPRLSQDKQSVLNICGCLIVVVVNTIINFFLSPFIVEHLGVEANGYITLANNFISYAALIITALDSMAGRFILIEIRKGHMKEANEYYSSVLFGEWFLTAILLIPVTIFIAFIDKAIQISGISVADVRLLFSLVFLAFFIPICMPKWNNATYVTNNLYLRSVKTAFSSIVRAVAIYILFLLCKPAVYFVAIAGLLMIATNLVFELVFKKILLPNLRVQIKAFRFSKIKTLLASGIWNTVSKCGDLLLEGLDILIANLYIDPVASGVLSLSKIVPNMIHQITGTIATTFGPKITYQYADGNIENVVTEVKNDIMLTALISNIPIGITMVFGASFFSLWVPSQDAGQLAMLTTITLMGMLASGIALCIKNIFTMANRLRFVSLITILSGLLNVAVTFLLLNYTNSGIYAIVTVSAVVTIIRVFAVIVPYGAVCIGESPFTFLGAMIKGMLTVMIPIIVGSILLTVFSVTSWLHLCVCVAITALCSIALDYIIVLDRNGKEKVRHLLVDIFFKNKRKHNGELN